jgi:hypothetical protein
VGEGAEMAMGVIEERINSHPHPYAFCKRKKKSILKPCVNFSLDTKKGEEIAFCERLK